MERNLLLLMFLMWPPEEARGDQHLLRFTSFCDKDELGNGQYDIEYDGDQLLYVNTSTLEVVQRLPEFAQDWSVEPTLEKQVYVEIGTCYYNLPRCLKGENFPEEVVVPPVSFIYPKQEMEPGRANTLVCFVSDFHPPEVEISWTLNGRPVDPGLVSQTGYYSNQDFSFRTSSYLRVEPQQGHIYSCSVAHMGLQAPLTKFWEVEVYTEQQLLEVCVCVCGVLLGLVGLVTGLCLVLKTNRSRRP